MAPKRFIAVLLAAALTAAATVAGAAPADPAAGKTRTLFVTVGEDRLRFELPQGMCFADRNDRQQGALLDMARRALDKKGDERLLGLFMPCDSLANPGNPLAREGRVPTVGLILWPHKIEAGSAHTDTAAYLDWRAPSFHEYAALNIPLWLFAADPLRQPGDNVHDPLIDDGHRASAAALMAAFSQYISADGQPVETVGALASMLVRQHPIEIVIRMNATGSDATIDQAYEFMSEFTGLQAALNR